MAVVLAGLGTFLYLRLGRDLDRTLDAGLRASADNVVALVREGGSGLGTEAGGSLVEAEESFAQVVAADGEIVDATPLVGDTPLLSDAELEAAGDSTVLIERTAVSGVDEPVRLLATPVDIDGEPAIVVVGTALDDRDDALASLRRQLVIGGPIVLLLASLAGYLLAGAALRPVESMRRRAAEISGSTPGERLPVPPARDEIARLGETLNEMLGRLETALERERRFVADASHELRTPLALLRTELELAQRRDRTRDELEAALRSAAVETERLSQLAEDLLVLARADRSGLPLQSTGLTAGEILGTVSDRFRRRLEDAGRTLAVDGELELTVRGDRMRLEQALGNLVENALRHGAGTVKLEARRNGRYAELHVLDEGPGFPEAFLPQAFERFSRADEARSRGGAGLGLAIVDVIAEAHGGDAGAANAGGNGADVWIALPLEP